jgi:hypothetical protein
LDAESHLIKYRQLQNRGLSLIKTEILHTLKNTTANILATMKASPANPASASSSSSSTSNNNSDVIAGVTTTAGAGAGANSGTVVSIDAASQFYVKFRIAAPKLRPLCEEIETRAHIKEYD